MKASTAGTKGVPRSEREQQILAVAIGEFARQGYAHTSVAEVAQLAGISKPLVYSYFDSKDGLYLGCLRATAEPIIDAVASAAAEGPALARGFASLDAIFRVLEPNRHAWYVLFDQTLPPGSTVDEAAHDYRRRLAAVTRTSVREVLTETDLRDQDLFGRMWMSALSAAVTWWIDHPDEDPATTSERCARVLMRAMGAEPGA